MDTFDQGVDAEIQAYVCVMEHVIADLAAQTDIPLHLIQRMD
jgi:hypothetical protein